MWGPFVLTEQRRPPLADQVVEPLAVAGDYVSGGAGIVERLNVGHTRQLHSARTAGDRSRALRSTICKLAYNAGDTNRLVIEISGAPELTFINITWHFAISITKQQRCRLV